MLISLLRITALAVGAQALNLTVSSIAGAAVSPFFYGFMFEDINYSGDGGLYAELIQNRNMKNGTTAYRSIGSATLSIDSADGVSAALPSSLAVAIPSNASGPVGFSNAGYDGISVTQQPYKASFYVKTPNSADFILDLRTDDGQVLGSANVSVAGSDAWQQFNATINPGVAAPSVNNSFVISTDGAQVAGQTLLFSLVSLFPPTFKGRENGLRNDLATALSEHGGKFLRFPGGNNIEGKNGIDSRWKWNQTIGPLIDRPGRMGTWGYPNTDGLGLIEYLEWTIDLGLEPILAVWGGLVLDGTVVPQAQLQPYVDEAMNELEFLLGDASTTYGAQRAALGYPNPFNITHVEVGNEDNLNGGFSSYKSYRFKAFADAILAKYPDMNIIASAPDFNIDVQSNGKGWADYHTYDRPDHLVSLHHQFDNVSRTIPIMVGEFAIVQGNIAGGASVNWSAPKLTYPNMIGAVAEATYMIGGERNADVVKAMTYAPGFNRIERTQWNPNMISFTSNPADTTRSTSYMVQKLFANNVGDTALAVSGAKPGPIYFSATKTDSCTFVKLANYNGTETSINISVPGCANSVATYSVLSAPDGLSYNSPGSEVTKVVTTEVKGNNGVFTVQLSNLDVAVLVIDAAGG